MRYLIIASLIALVGAGCQKTTPRYGDLPEEISSPKTGWLSFDCGTTTKTFKDKELVDLLVSIAQLEKTGNIRFWATSSTSTMRLEGRGVYGDIDQEIKVMFTCDGKDTYFAPKYWWINAVKEALIRNSEGVQLKGYN